MNNNTNTSRRQWLRRSVRWTLAVAMASLAEHLLRRKGTAGETPCADAAGRLGCCRCGQLKRCGLPRALSMKRFLKQQNEPTKS